MTHYTEKCPPGFPRAHRDVLLCPTNSPEPQRHYYCTQQRKALNHLRSLYVCQHDLLIITLLPLYNPKRLFGLPRHQEDGLYIHLKSTQAKNSSNPSMLMKITEKRWEMCLSTGYGPVLTRDSVCVRLLILGYFYWAFNIKQKSVKSLLVHGHATCKS